jgi:hypothetical protein
MVCQSGVSTLPRCQLPSSLLGRSLLAVPDATVVDFVANPLGAFLVTLVDATKVFLALAAVAWSFCVHLQCPEGQGLWPHERTINGGVFWGKSMKILYKWIFHCHVTHER